MRRSEDYHHSQEQVTEYVRTARNVCDTLELADDERAALLPTLVTLLASKQIFYEQAQMVPHLGLPNGMR